MSYDVQDFETEVIQASREGPVVVDFWAEWCGPCRILGPILEKLADESQERWRLAKVDTERFPEEASRYGVRGIPNVKLFVDGAPVDEFVGALPEHLVRAWLDRAIPSEADRAAAVALEKAKKLAEEGRFADARQQLESALADSPEDPQLRLELARIVVFDDPKRAESLLEKLDAPGGDQDVVDAIRHLARLLSRPGRVPEPTLERAPDEVRFGEAVERLRARDFEGTFETLLEVLRADGDAAREEAGKTCIALFHYLGSSHPIVSRFRGEVASALYR